MSTLHIYAVDLCTADLQTDPANFYVAFDQVQSESIHGQLSVTTAELRELKCRQQQLEARNVLLEKVAELNTVQQSGNWGVRSSSECTLLFCSSEHLQRH